VTVAGDIVAHLFVSTSGTDGDWIVKLIDVYPEQYPQDWKLSGRELMVANDVFRGRFRKRFDKPEPFTPNQVTPPRSTCTRRTTASSRGTASWRRRRAPGSR